jgi:hypothetical protein
MIINYYDFNTTLNELLFLDGVGYTHYYYPDDRLPEEGRYSDISNVLSLFGIKQKRWSLEHNPNNNQNWNQYLSRITENISIDIPVITSVNPFALPSLRSQFSVSDFLWYTLFPSGFHMILIIGYNLTNNTICYQDSNAGFYGENHSGDYAWMSLIDFREATEQVIWNRYYISTLNIINASLSPKQRFEHVININKQKMNGSYPGYNQTHGLTVSFQLAKDYSPGNQNITKTITLYQQDGGQGIQYTIKEIFYKILSKIRPDKPNIMAIYMIGEDNPFEAISREKIHVIHYLQNTTFHQDLCNNQTQLLQEESAKWSELAQHYKYFLRIGEFITYERATALIQSMKSQILDIIAIESQIILT